MGAAFDVIFSRGAEADLLRLFDFALDRELQSEAPDFAVPERAVEAIRGAVDLLRRSPFVCRKVGDSPFIRELVVPFGGAGYVVLFEIVDGTTVVVGAVRHQREDDYH